MRDLTEIANKYGTDKGTKYQEAHGYTEIYQKYIKPEGDYTLLEIGVWYGASIRMWKEYNPQMNLHAIDIDPRTADYSREFNIHIGDQTDRIFLENVAKKTGPLDFIIDDGSHVGDHIVKSFAFLFPHLKKGGHYFIEDLHAGHADRKNTLSRILEIIGSTPLRDNYNGRKTFYSSKNIIHLTWKRDFPKTSSRSASEDTTRKTTVSATKLLTTSMTSLSLLTTSE